MRTKNGLLVLLNTAFITIQVYSPNQANAAVVLVDTLPNSQFSTYGIDADQSLAQGFTTGNAGATIQDVTLPLGSVLSPGGGFALGLYSNAGGAPGSLLLTLTGSTDPRVHANYAFTGTFSLAAHTTYWIVATGTSSLAYGWDVTQDPSNSGSATLTTMRGNHNDGTGWYDTSTVYGKMEITATATPVPEPSTFFAGALLGLPLAIQSLRAIRRRSCKQLRP